MDRVEEREYPDWYFNGRKFRNRRNRRAVFFDARERDMRDRRVLERKSQGLIGGPQRVGQFAELCGLLVRAEKNHARAVVVRKAPDHIESQVERLHAFTDCLHRNANRFGQRRIDPAKKRGRNMIFLGAFVARIQTAIAQLLRNLRDARLRVGPERKTDKEFGLANLTGRRGMDLSFVRFQLS